MSVKYYLAYHSIYNYYLKVYEIHLQTRIDNLIKLNCNLQKHKHSKYSINHMGYILHPEYYTNTPYPLISHPKIHLNLEDQCTKLIDDLHSYEQDKNLLRNYIQTLNLHLTTKEEWESYVLSPVVPLLLKHYKDIHPLPKGNNFIDDNSKYLKILNKYINFKLLLG